MPSPDTERNPNFEYHDGLAGQRARETQDVSRDPETHDDTPALSIFFSSAPPVFGDVFNRIDIDSVQFTTLLCQVVLGVSVFSTTIFETVFFAFMAEVRIPMALHAAWVVGITVSLFGQDPGVMGGSTAAMAATVGELLSSRRIGEIGDGIELLVPSTVLAGFLMAVTSFTILSQLAVLLPVPVMMGFHNGVAVLMAVTITDVFRVPGTESFREGPELTAMIIMCLACALIREILPRIPPSIMRVIPSTLIAVIVATVVEHSLLRPNGIETPVLKDLVELEHKHALPIPFFLEVGGVNYAWENLKSWSCIRRVLMQTLKLVFIAILEIRMAAEAQQVVMKTYAVPDRTELAVGLSNILCGFFGLIGGTSIAPPLVICPNTAKGRVRRLGPLIASLGHLVCATTTCALLNFVPVAAIAGIILPHAFRTFNWSSLLMPVITLLPKRLRKRLGLRFQQSTPTFTLGVILVITVMTPCIDLAGATFVGLTLCSIRHAWSSAQNFVWGEFIDDGVKYYDITGPLFFGSANKFLKHLDPDKDPNSIIIRIGCSTMSMDYSAKDVLHQVVRRYAARGKKVTFKALNPESMKIARIANGVISAVSRTPSFHAAHASTSESESTLPPVPTTTVSR